MDDWIEVARIDQGTGQEARTVSVGERRIALFRHEGEWFAIDDACPHQGASLGEGQLHEGRVICPWHSWVFDLRTGCNPRGAHEPVTTYPVRYVDGALQIRIET